MKVTAYDAYKQFLIILYSEGLAMFRQLKLLGKSSINGQKSHVNSCQETGRNLQSHIRHFHTSNRPRNLPERFWSTVKLCLRVFQ